MKRVFLYVRVSTEEQVLHGLSIEAQTTALEEWARTEGHRVVGIYVDAGISARKPASKRPELQRLLGDVRAGRGDLIVFTKLDRWFRNIAEYYRVQDVLEKYHVDWKTIHEDYDTSTASGRFKINIMLSVAQDEADRTSERIKTINDMKRQKLEVLGGIAPLGYKAEGKKWVKDPEKEPAVAAFFAEYLATGSVSASMRKVKEDFGLSLSYQLASKLLARQTYCGRYNGVDGMTPPYITWEEHEKIVDMRKRTVRKTQQNRIYLFSGLLKCGECGKRMGGAFAQKSTNPYYHCSGHYEKARDCDNTVNINERKLAECILDRVEDKLAAYKAELARLEDGPKRNYRAEIEAARKKVDRLKYLFVDGLISIDEYKEDRADLDLQLAQLQERNRILELPNTDALDSLLCTGWRETYEESSREVKRKFLVALLKQVRVYKDRHIEFDLNI